MSGRTLEEVFLRLCATNQDLNAVSEDAAAEDSTAAEIHPDQFLEMLELMQLAAASPGSEPAPESAAESELVPAAAASLLSSSEQQVVEQAARLHQLLQESDVAFGSLIARLRTLSVSGDTAGQDFGLVNGQGTIQRQDSATQAVSAPTLLQGTTVEFAVPAGMGPGQSLQIKDPGQPDTAPLVTVTLPANAIAGQMVRVVVPSADAAAALDAPSPPPTMKEQTLAVFRKNGNLQRAQNKANCCYCCVFVLMLLFSLLTSYVSSILTSALSGGGAQFCPTNYQVCRPLLNTC